MTSFRIIASAIAATLTCACSTLPPAPSANAEVSVPSAWQQTPGAARTASAETWWRDFNDAQLDELIDTALTRNNDLAAAAITVRQARMKAGLAADKENPTLGASAGYSNSQPLRRDQGAASRSYNLGITVSYEADLWGKLDQQRSAAEWQAQASDEDREATAWSLTYTVATLYWQIAYLNQRTTLSAENIADSKHALDIARARYHSGDSSSLDVLQAEQTLASLQASHTTLVQQRQAARNAFAILFDALPGTAWAERASLPTGSLPEVQAGLPMQMLSCRPDLRAAQLRLKADLATTAATRASYFPSLSLTGNLGSSSASLVKIVNNPLAALGAELTLPFLQWHEMQLQVGVSQADYDKAVITFRQTLYSALADVDNALSARSLYRTQEQSLAQSLSAASRSEQLTEVRYRAGAASMKDWLDAKQTRRNAEVALAENRYNQFVNHATLYQALGGSPLSQKRCG